MAIPLKNLNPIKSPNESNFPIKTDAKLCKNTERDNIEILFP